MKKLYGIMPPIPTPFLNDEIAYDKLTGNISKWNKTGISGYVVMGSNGESVYLTREEKIKLVEQTKKNADSEKLIIAGTGSDSIKETIFLTNAAADAGADFGLILTPSFYKGQMKHEAFVKYFTAVADASKIPIMVYNVPKFTGVDIDVETVAKLAEHKNIIGIKNSTENARQATEFAAQTPDDFVTIIGTASVLFAGITAGASGGILALANIAPDECVRIQKFIEDGNLNEALALQNRMIPANTAVTAKFGVPGLKAAMDMLGYFGGEPRNPMSPLKENDKIVLKNILATAGLL